MGDSKQTPWPASCTKDAWDRDVAELHAAREEIERLSARVAELEAICNEPDPLPTELLAAQMDGDQRVVAMMRASLWMWQDDGSPLTSTGGEVLVPGEEP